MDHGKYASELFLDGCNCSQAVLMAFGDVTGLTPELAARLSSSFGGGMGRMREVCGAVSGMLMVAGILYGYSDPGEANCFKKEHYKRVQELAGQFREEFGSIVCREILKKPSDSPIPTPRTPQYYAERPCTRAVRTAAEILDRYIAAHPPAPSAQDSRC